MNDLHIPINSRINISYQFNLFYVLTTTLHRGIMEKRNRRSTVILNEAVSKRLRELRAGIKLSQAKLAAMFGVAQSLIARYETGEHLPPLELLIKYADFFDVSMDFLVGRTDAPQGKLYHYQPKAINDDKMREFVEMCFEPNSPANARLKEAVIKLFEGENK